MAFNRAIFLAILAVTAVELIGDAAAATFVVGDSMGWTVPSGGAAAYATYASQHVFTVGDVLVFNFPTGAHDVAQVMKDAYDGCSSTNPTILATLGPTSITLVSPGGAYFICTFGQHCQLGQKLAINVVANSTTPTPSTPTTPPAAPTPGGTATPPPSSTPAPGGTTTPPPTSTPGGTTTPPPSSTPVPGSTATPPPSASTPAHSPPTASTPAHSPGGMATTPALSPGGTATSPAPSPGGTATSPAPSPGGAATAPAPSPGGTSTSMPPGSSPSPTVGDLSPPGNAAAITSIGFSVVMIFSVAFGLMI